MIVRTQRRLVWAMALGFLVLPAEVAMLDAIRMETPRVDATKWASGLSAAEAEMVAADLFAYPYEYRRAVLAVLTPSGRSEAWRQLFRSYIAGHPELTHDQRAVLERAIGVASPAMFDAPVVPAHLAELKAIGTEARRLLGKEAADALFWLRGADTSRGAQLSARRRVAGWLQGRFTLLATNLFDDCECSVESGWCQAGQGSTEICSETVSCSPDTTWPMCGDLWSYACVGGCIPYVQGLEPTDVVGTR